MSRIDLKVERMRHGSRTISAVRLETVEQVIAQAVRLARNTRAYGRADYQTWEEAGRFLGSAVVTQHDARQKKRKQGAGA